MTDSTALANRANGQGDLIETWLPVSGYEGQYEVSDFGRVRVLVYRGRWGAFDRPMARLMQPTVTRYGYAVVDLKRNPQDRRQSRVHRLVLEAFVGPCPDGHEASHVNGDRIDNRRTNLRWESHTVNVGRRVDHGTLAAGERHGCAKLTAAQVREIRASAASGLTRRAIGQHYGVSRSAVDHIVNGTSWRLA